MNRVVVIDSNGENGHSDLLGVETVLYDPITMDDVGNIQYYQMVTKEQMELLIAYIEKVDRTESEVSMYALSLNPKCQH